MRRSLLVAAMLVMLVGSGCATGITGPPTETGPTSALVSGTFVTDTGGRVESWVEYGPTRAYGFSTEHVTSELDPGNFYGHIRRQITGLERGTTYHYRVCASDSTQQGGPGCGEDRRFTTQSVACGETVTTDVRLTGDMHCGGASVALQIGADGVDINLAGHALSGSISPRGDSSPGITNQSGYDDVSVRNGSLSGFNVAFSATDASRNRLLDVRANGLAVAASLVGGADNELRRSELSGVVNGAVLAKDSPRLVVADSELAAAFIDAGALIESDDARIVRNRFLPALDFEDRLPALKLVGNRAHIADNVVSGHWQGGFVLSGTGNVVVDNELSGLFGDGIFVSSLSSGVILRRNAVDGMADDGIEVQAPGTRLEDNTATDNGDWGIDAVAGVTDLGGNTASGNGQVSQCRNVLCQ